MTDEQKKVAEEIVTATTAAPTTTTDQPAPAATGPVMEELPDEIKKKLEKNKANRLAATKSKRRRRKTERTLTVGSAYIKSTYNNTIVTITDENGDVVSWASAGLAGFKGPKKSTPYAAQIITRIAVERAKEMGLTDVSVFVNGVGTGREAAVRALNANGLVVTSIKDVTPVPHNGCRQRKPRRV
jgi:small subunit ribosomal protein S11